MSAEQDLRDRVRAFLAGHDPAATPRDEFLAARFDAGLAAVHYPEGHGGLGLPRSLQTVADEEFAKAGAPPPFRRPVRRRCTGSGRTRSRPPR